MKSDTFSNSGVMMIVLMWIEIELNHKSLIEFEPLFS